MSGKPHLVLGILWQIIRMGLFANIDLALNPSKFNTLFHGSNVFKIWKLCWWMAKNCPIWMPLDLKNFYSVGSTITLLEPATTNLLVTLEKTSRTQRLTYTYCHKFSQMSWTHACIQMSWYVKSKLRSTDIISKLFLVVLILWPDSQTSTVKLRTCTPYL